jgi:drug/metabolite transporter, DME family
MTGAASAISEAASYRRGVLLVLAAGVCWSIMGVGIRLIENANVWQILFYRSLTLVPFLACVIGLRSHGRLTDAVRNVGVPGIVAGAALVLAFSGGVYSIQATTVANAMFLFATAPFMAAVLGLVILGEAVRRATWLAAVVALFGVAVMVGGGFSAGRGIGNLAALASALGFSIFTIALRWKKTDDMMPAVLIGATFAIIVSGLICVAQDLTFALSWRDIGISFGLGIFQVGAGLVLFTAGSKSVPAGELALLSLGEVILGPLWVWLFLYETVSIHTLVGGAILLLALAGNAISGMRRKPPPVALG